MLVEPRIVDRQRGTVGEVLHQYQIVGGVRLARRSAPDTQHTDDAALQAQRGSREAVYAESLQDWPLVGSGEQAHLVAG